MLVLSRKRNEAIIIGNDIRIVVVEVRGDKVRLGIEAPPTVPVNRQEIHAIITENARAQRTETTDSQQDASNEGVVDG